MEKSIFGLFTACMAIICFLGALQCYRNKRYGLGTVLLLNVASNLVNSIHAFSGTLF